MSPREHDAQIENDLLTQVKHGSKAKFEELYNKCSMKVYRYLFYLSSSNEIANDIVQETFIRVWEKRHVFNPQMATTGSYLLSVARNLYFQFLRSKKRVEKKHSDQSLQTQISEKVLHDPTAKLEVNKAVRQAIESLEPDLRRTLTLIYLEGLTFRETAAFLGLSQKAIEKRVQKAFDILHSQLAAYIK